jgi:O-antigen/teichoic acid export membrane protein
VISRKFIKSSLIYTLAGALPMGSAIILLPFYIHHLSTTLYGALSIYLSISLLVQILVTYSFDTSLYIHYHEFKNDAKKLAIFISSSFIFILLLGTGVGIVLSLGGEFFVRLFVEDKSVSFYPFGLAAIGIGIFQAVFKVFSNVMQTRGKAETYFWSNVLMFSSIAILTVLGLQIFPGSLIGPLIGRLLASLLVSAWALYRIFREFGYHFDFQWLRSSFGFNNYAFLYQIQQWVINYFDRILMAFFVPLHDVGIYDFGMKCMVVIEVILNGLHNSYYPKFVSTVMEQKEKGSTVALNRYYYGTTAVVMLLVSACVVVFPLLVDVFVWKPQYRESVQYLPLIACLYLFKTMRFYFAAPYGVLKMVKLLPKSYLLVAVIKITLMIMLLPYFHIYGVIAASVVGSVVEIILLKFYIRDHFRFQYNAFKLIFGPVVLFLLIILVELLTGVKVRLMVHAGYLIICTGLLFWMYRNEIGLVLPAGQIKKD